MHGLEPKWIAAYLADRLAESGYGAMNRDETIRIITPEFNTNGQMIFRDNIQKCVWGKNILLLIASASTGKSHYPFSGVH